MIWGGELEGIEGKILIYGAHLVALECFRFLIYKGKESSITGFAVTNRSGNPEEIEGIKVNDLNDLDEKLIDKTVVIATLEKYHMEIMSQLQQYNFREIIPLSDKWE